jgi:hypothetical protein
MKHTWKLTLFFPLNHLHGHEKENIIMTFHVIFEKIK